MPRFSCGLTLIGVFAVCLLSAARPAPVLQSPQERLDRGADAQLPALVELYRHFHSHPELSLQEHETAARLARELRGAGAEVTEKVGGTGVVGILRNGAGPTVMLRCDLDGLPVVEATGLDYASKVTTENDSGATVGVMHACGHDVHITNLVGTARLLAALRDEWRGTVMFVGQPAEERGGGARNMLEDGLFERFGKPDFALALHVDPTRPTGSVGYRAGYALANVDSVDVLIRGKGGHGAYPHTTIDPIVIAARFVLDVQTVVSREVKPIDPAVITVGSIHGGTKHNIIPDECRLELTVRSYGDDVRAQLIEGIRRKAKAAALSAGAPEPTVEVSEGTPAMYNDPALAERCVDVFHRVLGAENVQEAEAQMGGEDFSEYGRAGVPIFMYRLGSISPQRMAEAARNGNTLPSLHSALYYPDVEQTLRTAVRTMSAAVLDLLAKGQG
jgi:amidohydrolase